MAGEYTVKILSSEEFNKLPFKRIQDNPGSVYGAADKKNRLAYVRDTGFNDFTKANISHELDELMADVSPHEEDGIRYKDFSQSFGNFGSSIPVIGKATGALGRFAGSGIDALGSGASKIGLPNFNIGTPTTGQTGFPGLGTGSGSTSILQGGNTGASSILQGTQVNPFKMGSGFYGMGSGFPGMGGTSTQAQPNFIQNALSTVGNMFAPKQPTGGDQDGGGFGDIFGQVKNAAPGALVSMLGNLFAPKVDAPDFSGIKSDLQGKIGSEGGSPAYDLGFGEAQRQLGTEPGTLPPAVLAEMDLRRDEEIRALEDRFRMNQGGGGISESDTSRFGTLRNDIVKKFEALKQQTEFDYQNSQEARRITTMSEVLRLDTAQFQQYAQLAQLDMAELMIKTGIDQQTAMEFKTLFGNIGGQMIQSAFPSQTATV